MASLPASDGLRERLARRFDAWALARHPEGTATRLSHRNVYILPSRAGWLFAALLLALLILSINYQLNLGYMLTFLLAGSGMMAMHVTHGNLRGLRLTARSPEGTLHQGRPARLPLVLEAGARSRWGLTLRVDSPSRKPAPRRGLLRFLRKMATPATAAPAPAHADCARHGDTTATLSWAPPQRGLVPWPRVTIDSAYPLGLWEAWSRWQPRGTLLVLPAPEHPPVPLPAPQPMPGVGAAMRNGQGDPDGVRLYRPGDPLRHVLWKKFARSDELVSRDAARPQARAQTWLDFATLPAGLDTEARLSRLCAWAHAAEQAGIPWGLRLGTQTVPPGSGTAHLGHCLRLLALYPGPLRAPLPQKPGAAA